MKHLSQYCRASEPRIEPETYQIKTQEQLALSRDFLLRKLQVDVNVIFLQMVMKAVVLH
jgi:hypothetical protein